MKQEVASAAIVATTMLSLALAWTKAAQWHLRARAARIALCTNLRGFEHWTVEEYVAPRCTQHGPDLTCHNTLEAARRFALHDATRQNVCPAKEPCHTCKEDSRRIKRPLSRRSRMTCSSGSTEVVSISIHI